ncbi:MAG TPA: hypothetical protein VK031_05355 [Tissierellaceae bacterium]|nr:hypothetical protein [Tissierellaceae bacterium]
MTRRYKIKITKTREFVSLFNGIFKLSPKEIEIISEFIDMAAKLRGTGINPFSTEIKKKVSDNLGRDDFNTLNNYIKSLADKRAISKTDNGYNIHPMLLPEQVDKIEFHLIHE